MPALQCWRVSAVELSPPAPVSSEVQLGAVLAGHWSGEEATGGRSVAEVCVSNRVCNQGCRTVVILEYGFAFTHCVHLLS